MQDLRGQSNNNNSKSESQHSQEISFAPLHSNTKNSQNVGGARVIGYKTFDEFIRLSYNPGDTAWFKFGHNRFAVAQIDSAGYLGEIWETAGTELHR
ncbi:hypothetical protein, partial [Nostoc sp.]